MRTFNEVARAELARYSGLRDDAKRWLDQCEPVEPPKGDRPPKHKMRPNHAEAVRRIESEIALCEAMIKLIKRDKATPRIVERQQLEGNPAGDGG